MAIPKPDPKISYSTIKSKLLRPSLTSTYNAYFNVSQIVNGIDGEDVKIKGERKKFFNDRQITAEELGELLTISCSEASLPGSSLATHEINNDYTGVTERHVYRRLYDDRASFTFYVDSNYKVIKFFETWISWIVGEDQYRDQAKKYYNYRVKFPNDYRVDMHIQKYERDYGKPGSNYVEYTFIDAYPVDISSMPMSYDSSNLMKCTVSFVYTRYYMENVITAPIIEQESSNQVTDSVENLLSNINPSTGQYVSSQQPAFSQYSTL